MQPIWAPGILAEFLTATLNPSCAGGDHAAIYLEYNVIRWLMDLIGFPLVMNFHNQDRQAFRHS
jgi:hypothetical protein